MDSSQYQNKYRGGGGVKVVGIYAPILTSEQKAQMEYKPYGGIYRGYVRMFNSIFAYIQPATSEMHKNMVMPKDIS